MRKSFANLFCDVQDPALKRFAVVALGYSFKSRSGALSILMVFTFGLVGPEFKEISICQRKTFRLLC